MTAKLQPMILGLATLDLDAPDVLDQVRALRDTARAIMDRSGHPVRGITRYAAKPQNHDGPWSHGPSEHIWALGNLPEGQMVCALDDTGTVLARGLMLEGRIDWQGLLEAERRAAADSFYMEADLGLAPDGSRWTVEGDLGWETAGPSALGREVFVSCDSTKDGASQKKFLALQFRSGTAEILEATFDGEDIPRTAPDDAPMP